MVFKINSKTRIKILWQKLRKMLNSLDMVSVAVDAALHVLERDLGIKHTSNRWSKVGYVYYFKVVDTKKYMLARIKYAI
jgi:hypothetical protein